MLTAPSPSPSVVSAGMFGGVMPPGPGPPFPLSEQPARASTATAASAVARLNLLFIFADFLLVIAGTGNVRQRDRVLGSPTQLHRGTTHPGDIRRCRLQVLSHDHQP